MEPWDRGNEEDELVLGDSFRDLGTSRVMDDFFLRSTLRAGLRLLSYDRPEDEEPEPLWACVLAVAEAVVLVDPHDCAWRSSTGRGEG